MGKKKSAENTAVEKVLGERTEEGKVQYKVKYVGKNDLSWVDSDKLNCEEEIQEYLETKNGDAESEKEESEEEKSPTMPKSESENNKGESGEEEENGEDPDEEFEVECLVGDRTEGGKKQYKVRWRGYDSEQDTWENESNLDCPEIIEEYTSSKGTQKKRGRKPGAAKAAAKPAAPKTPAKSPPVKGKEAPKKRVRRDSDSQVKKRKKGAKERQPEKIVGLHTLKSGKRELLVRWVDLPEAEDSWEPEEAFINTPLHDEFLVKEKENRAKRAAKRERGEVEEEEEIDDEEDDEEDEEEEEEDGAEEEEEE